MSGSLLPPDPSPAGAWPLRRAVFLDRDGTIIEEVGYLKHPGQITFIPGAIEAIRMLRRAAFLIVVVTNQAGIARGLIDERALPLINERLCALLRDAGAALDGLYLCPHHPDGTVPAYSRICECRKPAPGMLLRAARELGIDLARSYVVGDKPSDVQAGRAAGARSIMVLTGHGREYPCGADDGVHLRCASLFEAAQWILRQERERP
jgi:D-glycero-D-manno-heptose 1,7-bisphosphate phosphatase